MEVKQGFGEASVKRRNRPTVVCINCKRRKSKCDRQKPCSNCVRFGNKDTCLYITDTKAAKKQQVLVSDIQKNGDMSISGNKSKKIPFMDESFMLSDKNYVNLSPNGNFVEFKRSAVTMFPYFCKESIENRDVYLRALVTFRSITIDMTMNTLKGTKNYFKNPCLPESFKPLSIFDAEGDPLSSDSLFRQHQQIHKSLFDKYGKYRRDESTKVFDTVELLRDNIPPRQFFLNYILVHFESYILEMVPIFEMEFLKCDINNFYDKWEQSKSISIKEFDHIICCIILLITKCCILSTHFAKLPSEFQDELRKIDTSKYIAVIHYYIFEVKFLKKCTLRQLQLLILLRFYHWCAPEDGDGASLQHSQILMGTIIACCHQMGISWLCLRDPNIFWFHLLGQSTHVPFILNPEDCKIIYQKIWSYILHWDRKTFLVNGQECLIGKSYEYDARGNALSWHHEMITLDHIIIKMNNILNDMPSKVDIVALKKEWDNAWQLFERLKNTQDKYSPLNFEYEITLELFMLCLLHAEFVHLEQFKDVDGFHILAQSLWDQIVKLANKCHRYFYGPQEMDLYNRFFTNKIVGVVADKLCILIPAFLLRLNRFGRMGFDQKNMMVKFLFGICSMYYNEFGFDYYRCFESMFTAKISYKILNRPRNKSPWKIILDFLLQQLERKNARDQMRELEIIHNLPILVHFRDRLKLLPEVHRDAVKLWDTEVIPMGNFSSDFSLNLHEESLRLFFMDRYSQIFNIFSSFYDHASSQLADETEGTGLKKQDDLRNTRGQSQGIAGMNPAQLDPTDPAYLEKSNLDLIRDMFEPLDIISFFQG